jgi:NAD(P)-dependent dehydrogenase (short-subunit alcohol dehydrogenase family)
MFLIVVLVTIYYLSYQLYQHFFPTLNIDPNGKYVLISGCDTGFGHGLALELDKQGFNVLAGVFVPENVVILKNKLSSKGTVFRLDITKQDDIDATYNLVKNKTNILHALVNNAGINAGSYIDWTPLELMRKVMDVNFFGHVVMTKKFLPLLIAKRDSRVVNTSSINGFMSVTGTSSYSASKYAMESFSDCLRREMFPWGLRVSIIEPGVMRTPIIEGIHDHLRNLWDQLSGDVQERWGVGFLNNTMEKWVSSPMILNAEDPMKVVRALQHAVMNTNPRIRYRPGWQSKLIYLLFRFSPVWLQDKFLIYALTFVPAGVRHQLID